MRRRSLPALLAVLVLPLAGCGGDAGGGGAATQDADPRSDRLVDLSKDPPLVNDLNRDPANGDFLLTTNRGFFRISSDGERVTQVEGKVSADGRQAPVGTFLSFTVVDDKTLLGSGHPDTDQPLPEYLGLIRSEDLGETWVNVSRLGEADLHKLVFLHGRLYAFDAVLGAMLISEDGGRSFQERFTPRGLIIDFAVDPEDPRYILAATEQQLFKTEDQGQGWRPLQPGAGMRLAWPAKGKLYRADQDGTVHVSANRGESWEQVGKVPGEPYKFHEEGPDELFLALSDGTIVQTEDGGRTWTKRFQP